MYLQLLNYLSNFFSLLFIAFLCWSLNWKMIKQIWKNSKASVLIKKKVKEATADGKRAFSFEKGNVIIYAKTHPKALYDYKQLKKESKQVKNQLKKT
ncbi:hypothetical protein SAMN05444338_109132 [Flavobacterium degerlachei]|uniref:Uncharacterized protein n=2 Tax=Flavobacterium degerlachei TaxID=229203 RepID=A0A1H3B4A7_9FLAO|nr:hypothetical protein SAMN05444338_109132 [Flavobacterium degerlachei]